MNGPRFEDARGSALVSTLVVLLGLLGLTTAALMATSSDLKISSNYQTGTQALLNAQSGILHAAETINDLGVSADFRSEIISKWGTLFPAGPVALAGYPLQSYTVAAIADATDPAGHLVLFSSGQGPNESQRSIAARVTLGGVFSPGAIYLPGQVVQPTFNGNSFYVDGFDTNLDGSRNPSGDVPGIATNSENGVSSVLDALSQLQADNVVGQGGMPSVKQSNGFSTEKLLQQIVPSILGRPGAVTDPQLNGNDVFGTLSTPQITHFTGNVNVNGNLSGVGILLVDGGLTISGSSTFTGLIVVQGTTQITTVQGNTTILGALWTTDLRLVVGGSASVTYSSQALALVNALFPSGLLPRRVKVTAWKDSA